MNREVRSRAFVAAVSLFAALGLAGACSPTVVPSPAAGGPRAPAPRSDDAASPPPAPDHERLVLRDGWSLQSSAAIGRASGKEISTAGYSAADWYPTVVPTTVFAALVANHVYPDPYVGNNLTIAPPSAFDVSWWYRTELTLGATASPHSLSLELEGVNFKANVWLNGQLIAPASQVAGTFTAYDLDVSSVAIPGARNALAIEVFPPDLKKDLAISWLDWNPGPPDRNMGLWRGVSLRRSGPVAVRKTHVRSTLEESLAAAHLVLKTNVVNTSASPVHATVRGAIGTIEVTQEVDLAAHETKTVTFEPSRYPALDVDRPKVWWPAQMGAPNMYDLRLSAAVAGVESDSESVRFGIRNVTFEPTKDGYRLFRVNGRPFFVRGGGWASDMMLRPISPARLGHELDYVRDLGLNTIRLEGKLESNEFFDRADELGIVTIPGWMCCDRWQDSATWTSADHQLAVRSMETQAERLRNHPSVVDFLIGSDEAPTADAQKEFRDALARSDWPNPVSRSASDDGVKMTGPYDWVPPAYWYLDKKKFGGAWGFNTETGPGPAIPEVESLKAMLAPAELVALWSEPKAKLFHAGTRGTEFDSLLIFNAALSARHGAATSLDDYVAKAQLMNYEAERAEYEAYSRNKYAPATGVVHWMLNNAWPSLIWHLYGYDLAPAAGYFGAKKANEPLHIQYSYDDRSVVVVNQTPDAKSGLRARVRVLELDAKERFAKDASVDVAKDSTTKVLTIPALAGGPSTYFVQLTLTDGGRVASENFYWLSRSPETMDFARTKGHDTPTTHYADYKALGGIAAGPKVVLHASARTEASGGADGGARVTLENASPSVAFFVRLKLTLGPSGEPVLPVLWEDNYVSLLPGEKRELTVRYERSDLHGASPAVEVSGWNVAKTLVDVVSPGHDNQK